MNSIKFENERLVDALMKQHKGNNVLVKALKQRIQVLEQELEKEREGGYARYVFFVDHHPELIPEFVKVVYENCEERESAKDEVAAFHDETIDLSTLDVTGKDFDPWGE